MTSRRKLVVLWDDLKSYSKSEIRNSHLETKPHDWYIMARMIFVDFVVVVLGYFSEQNVANICCQPLCFLLKELGNIPGIYYVFFSNNVWLMLEVHWSCVDNFVILFCSVLFFMFFKFQFQLLLFTFNCGWINMPVWSFPGQV